MPTPPLPTGLDALTAVPVGEAPRTLRWVLAHMTSETVRHAGHADILRELIDGTLVADCVIPAQ